MREYRSNVVLAVALTVAVGCEGSKPSQVPLARPVGPLAIRRPDSTLRVFSGQDETPGATYAFEGAGGSVRVTMEVDGASASNATNPPPTINDVLFKAEGNGRISIAFKRPWPEHRNGRVTIVCQSGDEQSSATFEPELWHHLPGAIITLEPSMVEPTVAVVAGKEIVLGRYVTRNVPRDLRLTFKAVFTKEPFAPRTKAGLKPPG